MFRSKRSAKKTKTPIRPNPSGKKRKKTGSSKKRRMASPTDQNVIGSDSEYEYIRVRKSDKKPLRDVESSEEREPATKIKPTPSRSKYASKSKPKTGRKKQRYEEELDDSYEKARSKSKSPKRRYATRERMDSQTTSKKEKKVLFQVDINMDSK